MFYNHTIEYQHIIQMNQLYSTKQTNLTDIMLNMPHVNEGMLNATSYVTLNVEICSVRSQGRAVLGEKRKASVFLVTSIVFLI